MYSCKCKSPSAVQHSKYLMPDAPNHAPIRLRRASSCGAVQLGLPAQFSSGLAQEADERPPCHRGDVTMLKRPLFESLTAGATMISLRHHHRALWSGQRGLGIAPMDTPS